MAHKTLINGTAYNIVGGTALVEGTKKIIKAGKTLIGGTAYNILFSKGYDIATDWPGWSKAQWKDINNLCVAKQRGWINTWPSDVVIGAEKRIRLPWNEIDYNLYMRIVGIDLDADGTLTFAPKQLIGNYTFSQNSNIADYYSEYNNYYINNDGSQCKKFYDYCTLKPEILPVLKGTCITSSSNRNGTVVYREQAVWLFSEMEVGLDTNSGISASNATLYNAECTYGKKFSYPGLNTAALRTIINLEDYSNGRWFLRGAYYQYSSATCIVDSSGGAGHQNAGTSRGFLPGFVIGNPSAATI